MTQQTAIKDDKYRPIDRLVDPNIRIECQHHLKFLWHRDRVRQFLQGSIYDVHPVTTEIVPSLECNYSCRHCTYAEWKEQTQMSRGRRLMSEGTINTVLERLCEFGVKSVIFTGGGEPFFNRNTSKCIAYAKEIGLDIGIFTNGSLLTPESIKTVISNSNFMRISLNAITVSTYLRFHNISNPQLLERVKRNIRRIASSLEGSQMKFGLGVIVNETNKDDLVNIAIFVAELLSKTKGRIDYVGVRPVINYRNRTFQISTQVTEAVRIARPEVNRILKDVGTLAFWATDYFEDVVETKRTKAKQYVRCLANPWAVSVAYDGGVYLCSEHDGDSNFFIGNIIQQKMDEIWRSDRRKQVIESIGDCVAPTCKLHRLNKILNEWNNQGLGGDNPLRESQLIELDTTIDSLTCKGEPGGKSFL